VGGGDELGMEPPREEPGGGELLVAVVATGSSADADEPPPEAPAEPVVPSKPNSGAGSERFARFG
jgi:hypothetical protein